ncbi:cob(I)yrinic acid a,c-diamide adenosyltransferase [Mycolicibacterium goodii]|uniref:Cob(I)yrinic acid a,c-diamide adenosyltransferase n=1 Tax=Mycolicibacterium goodii TaxID=134601 RepID=A0A0K0X8V1_MYCGD|nr:hypothetical protein AFA91_20095 [Mycolicibacterium goodii]
MPQGHPAVIPDDRLTTRQRRNRPILMVHTGEGKGKSTAAFGLALRGWNQGFRIGVFQFVKSAKWRIGEQTVLERTALAQRPGQQHVVITGRRADPRLIEIADLVTEMGKVKHPMDAGQKGQRGIEW